MEIISTETSEEKIGKITQAVHKINEARAEWNRQALVNVMFLYGKQHFTINRMDKSISVGQRLVWELENRNNQVIRRTSNYILPLFRSVLSRLIRRKGSVYATPMTATQEDRDAAKVSKEVLEDFWQNCNRHDPYLREELSGMQAVLNKMLLYDMSIGTAYLIPFFNPRASAYVYDQATKEIIQAEVGQAEIRVASPLNLFLDRFKRYSIERQYVSVDQVYEEFGIEVAPCEENDEDTEVKIRRTLEGVDADKTDKDGVYIFRKTCLPNKEYPKGQLIVCTGKDLLYEGELPPENFNRLNCFEFRYQDLGFSPRGQGAIEQVVDLQQDYNYTLSRIAQHKKLMTGKILSPKGAELTVKHDDTVGQIIQYALGRKPTMEPAPSVPAYYFEELRRIRNDMEGLMNSHDVSMGRTPGQVSSGVGIQSLSEIDNSQIAPELIMLEQKLGFTMEAVLDIIQEKYSERRLLNISGEDMAFEIKSFIGSDLFGQKNIQVKMGSNFPIDPEARTNYILMLKKEGFISPDKAKSLLELNDIDGAFHSLDESGAKQDILNTIEGNAIVIAEPFEDHTIYLKVINDFRKGNVYAKLPEDKRMAINDLAAQHEQYLLQEQQAASELGVGLPAPAKQD